jgi:prepilin-type N-terminal cleavage/methylation domain-containing protein
MNITQHLRRAFSLLEMVAVLVLILVIAGLAIPTYQAVIGESKERTLELSAKAAVSELQALQRLRGDQLTLTDVDAVYWDDILNHACPETGTTSRHCGGLLPRFAADQIRFVLTDATFNDEDSFMAGKWAVCIYAPASLVAGEVVVRPPFGDRDEAITDGGAVWSYDVEQVTTTGVIPWGYNDESDPAATPCG